MTTPLCPDCHAPLSADRTACPVCRLPLTGDDAAELGRIDSELVAINTRLGAIDSERTYLQARRTAVLTRRQSLITRLRAAAHQLATPRIPAPPEGAGQQSSAGLYPAAKVAVETSGYSVQAVLLALGGTLLAVAAIAFTVFAWGHFGIPGRAVVLAALTGVTFAVPVVLTRRRLTSTAETIALLGLVLLALDGYAAWRVGLSGSVPGHVYAGLVGGAVALAGALYPLAVAVRLPRLAAIVVGQAVLPLLLWHLDALPWGTAAALVAAADLALVALAKRRTAPQELVLAAVAGGLAGVVAAVSALAQLAVDRPVPGALLLAALAALGLVTAEVIGAPLARQVAAAAAIPAIGLGAFRVYVEYGPGWALTGAAVMVLAFVAVGRVVPVAWRHGTLIGAASVGGVAGVLPVGVACAALLAPIGWVTRPWGLRALDAVQVTPGFHGSPGADFAAALVILGIAATLAAALFGRTAARYAAAIGAAAVSVVLPTALHATVWAAVLIVLVLAGALAVRLTAVAVVLTVHAAVLALSSEPVSVAALAAIALGWGGLAVARRKTDRPALAAAVVVALLAVSAEVAAVAVAVHAPRLVVAYALVLSSAVAFGAALRLPRTAAVAALAVVPVAAYSGALTGFGATDRAGAGLLGALTAAALAGFGAALRRTSGNRVFGATQVFGLLAALAAIAEPLAHVVLRYLGPLMDAWHGAPTTTRTGSWLDVLTLAVLAVAAAALADVYRQSRVVAAAVPAAAAALLAAQTPWTLALATAAVLALGAAALAAYRQHPVAIGLTAGLGSLALTLSLATRPATLVVLALAAAAGAATTRFGRGERTRTAGLAIGSLAALAEGYAAAAATGLPPHRAAYGLLAVAAALAAYRPLERWAALGGVAALVLTLGHGTATATVLTLGGVIVGLVAALREGRRRAAWAALGLELVASWVWLGTAGVTVPEAYTLPGGLVGIGAGLWVLRREESRSSWTTLGPGLAAALAPSLALVFGPAGTAWRPLLLGVAALGLTLAGAAWRRQAPFVLGAGVLALVAARQLWPYLPMIAAAVPTWVPLTLGGLLLVGVGATYERRLRDVARVRELVGRMR